MTKNKLITTALLVILPFFLTACSTKDLPVIGKYLPEFSFPPKGGPSSDFPTGEVKLTVWGLWENTEVVDVLIKKYKEIHPNVSITYENRSVLKPGDYKDTVYTRLGQQDESIPNVVMVHSSWVPGLKANLEPAPSKLITPEAYNNNFYPSASKVAVSDGAVYAVPAYYDGLVLVYNKKHFAEVNQAQPPASWEEFRRLALELTIRSGDSKLVRGGAAIGTFKNIEFASDILGLMFTQAGLKFPSDLDTKPAQDALTFYSNFAIEDKVWNDNFPEASAAFSQEKTSMIFIPTWNLLDILQSRPDWATSGNIGVARVPQAIIQEPASWGSFWMMTVPNKSANKTVAWDFINFLSQAEQERSWYDEASKFRPFGPAYALKSLKGDLANNAYLSPLLEDAAYSSTGLMSARSGNKTVAEVIGKALNDIIYSGLKAEKIMPEVKEKLVNTK